ncbi:MAG TPA: YqeG family HAD IIIA-type phosphatase [Clostridiales bacterium]|nr:MAG: hypothetical protein A2Y18_01160 [Clostridiales bacterium GWD2_32_19]HCC08085.1 YqeG family HAD IIIA-type phosphatase [Clostridiales bacterium]
MLRKLKPDIYVDTVHMVDYHKLKEEGIKGLIFDIDNTLITYEEDMPNDKTHELFERLRQMEFTISFVSNGPKRRVDKFNVRLNFNACHRAMKPLIINLSKVIGEMKMKTSEVVIIGDQLFTDVLAGNRIGIKTILVNPIKPKDSIVERVKRNIENKLLQKFNKKT